MAKRQNMAVPRADAFVAAANASARMALRCESVPERCRLPETTSEGPGDWRVVSAPGAGWLPELEDQLPYRWPFRALIGRYLFPSFVCGPLRLYSIGVKDFAAEDTELSIAVMRDRPLLTALWKHGYQPFARPADGSYDPLCFDCGNSSPSAEPAVVRVDHERIRISQRLSPAFYLLLEEMTESLSSHSRTSS